MDRIAALRQELTMAHRMLEQRAGHRVLPVSDSGGTGSQLKLANSESNYSIADLSPQSFDFAALPEASKINQGVPPRSGASHEDYGAAVQKCAPSFSFRPIEQDRF